MNSVVKISIFIVIAFALGLVMFFAFSAEFGDGLEMTLEEAGVEEADQVLSAPLSYGDNYIVSLIMGIVGAALVLGLTWGIGKGLSKREG